jgi:hypothetical protein
MPAQSGTNFVLNWAKERIDEMDATLASLESQAAAMRAESRVRVDHFIADLRQKRNEFESMFEKQVEAGEAAWDAIEARLETQWKGFETEIKKYLEAFGPDIKQQQALFQSQMTAQINAWRGTADKIHGAAAEFAAERRNDIDATVSRMRADAAAAEEKLQQLARTGTESWSALNAALTETRAVFDRANQAAQEAFKRATGSAQ